MGFREAVTVCIQDYYTFSGRARRPEYWWFFLFVVVGTLLLSAVDAVIFGEDMLLGLNGLFGLLTFLPQLAVSWRRMHDTGRPGWFNLLPVVPIVPLFIIDPGDPVPKLVLMFMSVVVMIAVLVWLVHPSQPMPNRFGPEPPP
ncbi:MAG: DUF805 domain-containing protein [Proteobacteria bacterium]|nr:DUF805 domain-containing protein [Pseudomonadota bacterium]